MSFIAALAALLVGALILNGVTQSIEGRDTVFLHFGFVTLIVVVGGVLFPFWAWTSTAWVLGVATLLTVVPALWGRYLGDGPSQGYLWHGDPPGGAEDHSTLKDERGGPE